MENQNLFMITDYTDCPDGEGSIIDTYLDEIYSRIANTLNSVSKPVDWLMVDSENLFSIIWDSRSFFEYKLEEALRETFQENITVIKGDTMGFGGVIKRENIEKGILEKLGREDFSFNYLNHLDLGSSVIGYHLNMRDSVNYRRENCLISA